jgi:hypothetical protein
MDSNPFAALSLIVAPAILTNASSVLILSTSNRFARAIDRARVVAGEIEKGLIAPELTPLRMGQLMRLERRSILLLQAMRLFYLALGSFATATLVSVVGAVVAARRGTLLLEGLELLAAAAGFVGVGGLVVGSGCLVRDTRLAVANITEEANHLRARMPRPPAGSAVD